MLPASGFLGTPEMKSGVHHKKSAQRVHEANNMQGERGNAVLSEHELGQSEEAGKMHPECDH